MIEMRKARHRGAGQDNLFGWTVFLLLLAAFAAISWVGSFYVFGHPEKSFSYGILRTLGKIDAPKRFELTKAPRGQFLDAAKLLERFGQMPPRELDAANDALLRNYLRNYERTKDLVPYVIGDFDVVGAFRLGPKNFFPDGVVALARSNDNPSLLLELIFPSAEADAGQLERMLRMGLDLQLARTLDLTAVINIRTLPDNRLIVTAVPLLYGSYSSTGATGTLNLEPPPHLNVSAGLPLLNAAAVEEAEKRFAAYVERSGKPVHAPALMRVQRSEPVAESAIPVARAEAVNPPRDAADRTPEAIPVARAVAVDQAPEDVTVRRAEAVRPEPNAAAVPVRRAEPVRDAAAGPATPVQVPAVPLQPFVADEASTPQPAQNP